MTNLFDYSQAPSSNNATPPDGAPEGQAPSTINNVIRQFMANAAGAFKCYTAGGSANAQTVTMDPTLAAYSNKVRIAFIPVANNTGACTLNVNSLGAVSIKMIDGTDPPAGALNASGVAVVQHNGTNFVLLTPAGLVGLGVTATVAEVNTLNGVTATTAELNKTDDSAAAVSGFVSGTRIYRLENGGDTTVFDVDANVTESTFESVGPTGSGATNEWPAMDSITAGATMAIITVLATITSDEGGTTTQLNVYARKTGDSASAGSANTIAWVGYPGNNLAVVPFHAQIGGHVFVPLDSSRRFDITWAAIGDAARSAHIYLHGFVI